MNKRKKQYLADLLVDIPDLDSIIIEKAEEDNSFAQLDIGEVYCLKTNLVDNYEKAFYWLSLAGQQRNIKAQFMLGDLYALGKGAEKDEFKAYQWYMKSAIQGYPKALTRLHNLYHNEKGMYCRGQRNSDEEEWIQPKFKKQNKIRELFEYRVQQMASELTNTKQYFTKLLNDCRKQNTADADLTLGFLYRHGFGIRKNIFGAIKFYTLAAEKGNNDAQYNLASIYHTHHDMKWNYRKAFKWYTKAAENGNIYAQSGLALLYQHGIGVDTDYSKTIYWYTQAAEMRNVKAQISLGCIFRKGEIVNQDDAKAVEWYKRAAKEGSLVAQNCLDLLDRNSNITTNDKSGRFFEGKSPRKYSKGLCSKLRDDVETITQSIELKKIEKLALNAMKKDGHAMHEIGLKYFNGDKEFIQDKYTGIKWIKNAANAKHKAAQLMMANLYKEGDWIEQDYYKATIWYKTLAKQNDANAQYNVGIMYKKGLGVRKDLLEASRWFTWAVIHQNIDAQYQLGLLKVKGEGVRQDEQEAANLFYRSAILGNPFACFELGALAEKWYKMVRSENPFQIYYGYGIYYDQDRPAEEYAEEAERLYSFAARKGNGIAGYRLGEIYEDGIFGYSNLTRSIHYYSMGADSGNVNCMVNLAIIYLDKERFTGDQVKAYDMLRQAANQNHDDAAKLFGTPITLGETSFDLPAIIDLFKQVSSRSIASLEYNVGYAYEYGIDSYSKQNSFHIDYKSAELWYSIGADKGDNRAQYRLGVMYEEGKGVQKNLEKAFALYCQAHNNGNSNATYSLAQMYLNGHGVDQDLIKAFYLFTDASNMGHKQVHKFLEPSNSSNSLKMLENIAELGVIAIQYQLGIFYQLENENLSFKWFNLAAEGGITDIYYRLGVFYQEGSGTDRDYSKAMKFYEKATIKDHEEAMYKLAQMYLHGKGTKVNYKKAYEFFTMASNQNHYLSRKFLNVTKQPFSEIYKENKHRFTIADWERNNMDHSFVSTSDEFASLILMYKYVAEQGDVEAQYVLGLAFEESFNKPNHIEASKWYTMAANNSHSKGMYRLGLLYEKGLGVSQDYCEAVRLYNNSSMLGDYNALYRLAKMYHYGKGVQADLVKAIQCYTDAANNGQAEAQYMLGSFYQEGELLPRNFLTALKWLTMSYSQGYDKPGTYLYTLYIDKPLEDYFFYRRLRNMLSVISFNHEVDGRIYYTCGNFFLHGIGADKNFKNAWKHLTMAVKRYGYHDKDHLIELILSSELLFFEKLADQKDRERSQNLFAYTQFFVGEYYFFLANQGKSAFLSKKFTKSGIDTTMPQNEESTTGYYQKAMHYLSLAASSGDKEAQYYLGKMYLNGYGVSINPTQASTRFAEAAEQQHIDAQYELGLLYFSGVHTEIDYMTSLGYIKRAALAGHEKALFHLGWMYKHGLGLTKNMEEANKWFDVSLSSMQAECPYDFDNIDLIKHIKQIKVENLDTDSSFDESIIELKERAAYDDEARYDLSQIFLHGKGVDKNLSKAISYLRNGAQTHLLCQEELALLYYNGELMWKNLRLATIWFKRGAEKRSNRSMFYLAQIYHSGLVDGHDFLGALKLYQAVGGLYYPLALQQTGLLYEYGDGIKKNHSMAYRYYIKSFKENNYISGYNIALMYFYGKGVKQDYREAIAWLEKSLCKSTITHFRYVLIETKSPEIVTEEGSFNRKYSIVSYDEFLGEILYLLGKIYSDGLGIERDVQKAKNYFSQAVEKENLKAKNHLGKNL